LPRPPNGAGLGATGPMPHYDAGEWSDFVRGLIPGPKGGKMEAHLVTCTACQRTASLFRQVAVTARRDRQLDPPDHLVRWARTVFSTRDHAPAHAPGRLIAGLVYDSLAAPELAGVRAQSRISRHLLYEAGAFGLDLRLEYERGSPRVTLVGQILDRDHPERSLIGVSVQLVRGRTQVSRAQCNRFGEFQIEYEPHGRLRLYVSDEHRRQRVEVSLNGLQSHQSGQ
jgi:hypothetical protein